MSCNRRFLIAEDDADIIELLSLYLGGEGYHILPAENGRQALELVRSQKISLAIVDIMMPEINGYDLIRKIRETQNFPIIILSAKTMDTDRILGLNLGADAYMTKPFNPLEVVAYVKAALRRYYSLGGEASTGAPIEEEGSLTVGELQLDLYKFILRKRGHVIPVNAHRAENCCQIDAVAGAGVYQGTIVHLYWRGTV